jgi:hypothetical protein
MDQNRFGHLYVQELFLKGYFTSVFSAFDKTRNKGVLLQIITPIFSSNKRYNELLEEYAKQINSSNFPSFLAISQILTDSGRVGLVYDFPNGLAEEWKTFSSLAVHPSPVIIEACQRTLPIALSSLEKKKVLHRALRPDAFVYNEESKQVFVTFCGLFETLFYLETKQNPPYQGQFQANFYSAERLSVFHLYDAKDEYYSFAKTWYFLDMLKNQIPVKTMGANLQSLKIADNNSLAAQLNVLLSGSLQEKQQTFAADFHAEEISIPSFEKPSEVEPAISDEQITNAEEKDKVELPPFEQPPIKQQEPIYVANKSASLINDNAHFPWKKFGLISGVAAAILVLVVTFYSMRSGDESVPKQKLSAIQPKEEKTLEKDSLPLEKKSPPRIDNALPANASDKKLKNPTISAIASIDNSTGLSQLDALSELVDKSKSLSKKDRKLLIIKAEELYMNLPQLATQLTSTDQRKLCNYRSKFENYLRRNKCKVNASIAKELDVHCN